MELPDATDLTVSESPTGRWTAIASWIAAPVSVGILVYVHINPHELVFLDGGLILIWICGAVVSLLGVLLAMFSILRSRFRRWMPWLTLTVNGVIVIYAILAPILAIINGLTEMDTPGWH